jgi:hypothetical protein
MIMSQLLSAWRCPTVDGQPRNASEQPFLDIKGAFLKPTCAVTVALSEYCIILLLAYALQSEMSARQYSRIDNK